MRIGVTATQKGLTPQQKVAARLWFKHATVRKGPVEVHDGDCVGGDSDLYMIAKCVGLPTVCHPPIIRRKRANNVHDVTLPPLDYLERNKMIVRSCDLLLVFPKGFQEELRSGTWSTFRYARSPIMQKPTVVVFPNGTMDSYYLTSEQSEVLHDIREGMIGQT